MLTEITSKLYELITEVKLDDSIMEKFTQSEKVSTSGIPLQVVYKIRNLFAHGNLVFPDVDWEDETGSVSVILIAHSSKIVLLSLQMLLIAYYKDKLISFNVNGLNEIEYFEYNDYKVVSLIDIL